MNKLRKRKGQALVMVTFGLLAVVGLVGLGVDLSWSYFLEKTMQAAADTAAISAVQAARVAGGAFANVNCGGTISCYATQTSCSSINSGSADKACLYALENGFARSEVTIVASDDTTAPTVTDTACSAPETVNRPPTAGCVNTLYWVTVRITRQVPQLFSAILGNYRGTVSARATAAVAESILEGSLILINRENDLNGLSPDGAPPSGTNLELGGNGQVRVPGGIILASNSSTEDYESGRINANAGYVISPWTHVRDGGAIGGQHSDNWICDALNPVYCAPQQSGSDGTQFQDPISLKFNGQPPLDTTLASNPANYIDVPNGIITTGEGGVCPNGVCREGIYVATVPDCGGCSTWHPSGARVRINAQNGPITFEGGTFGEYMFVGGLDIGNNSNVTMGPGRYVLAGVADTRQALLEITSGVTLTGGNGNDAGRLLIYTDFRTGAQREGTDPNTPIPASSYAGQMDVIFEGLQDKYEAQNCSGSCSGPSWNLVPFKDSGLRHGKIDIQAGNNAQSRVTLHGLKAGDGNIPTDLRPYEKFAMWQDQHNSYIKYNNNAQVDFTSCGGGHDINNPCTRTPDGDVDDSVPELGLRASPHTTYSGVIYQPRGAWTSLQANGRYEGPIQIVTGAMRVWGGPDLELTGLTVPLTIYTVSLVE